MDRTGGSGGRNSGGGAGCARCLEKGKARRAGSGAVSPPRRPAWLLVLAVPVTLGLGACGGGGGPAAAGLGSGGPGGAGSSSTARPGLTAGGVTASIQFSGGPVIEIRKGSEIWTDAPPASLAAPSGWTAATRLDAAPDAATARFHAVTNIASDSDGDYLAYGFWSRHAPDTQEAAGFQPFFYGKTPYAGNVATLPIADPPLSYTGGAAGVFRIAGTDDYGHFTANIELRAGFGSGGKVQGEITGITPLTPVTGFGFGDIEGLFAQYSGNRFAGSGSTNASRWEGSFFGPSGGGQPPTGVGGRFEALYSESTVDGDDRGARLSGSFGAAR